LQLPCLNIYKGLKKGYGDNFETVWHGVMGIRRAGDLITCSASPTQGTNRAEKANPVYQVAKNESGDAGQLLNCLIC